MAKTKPKLTNFPSAAADRKKISFIKDIELDSENEVLGFSPFKKDDVKYGK